MSAFPWTDGDVRRALGLRNDLAVDGLAFSGVSTDSRTVESGELYVALVGDRFDGHDFVVDALARGAGGAVVSRPVSGDSEARLYPVDDTLGRGNHGLFREDHYQGLRCGYGGGGQEG
jgi:UDP-N-acetylmuramoyl-tripeptide--D-alanyl-D-alanine ligase